MDIADIIEEKYTKYLNCEVDYLDLTIEEAKHILANDRKEHFVDDLLYEAYKVVLNELEKKDKVINEIKKDIESNIYLAESNYEIEELNNYARGMYDTYINMRNEYFTNKAENVGE